jgi:hypothetical protein
MSKTTVLKAWVMACAGLALASCEGHGTALKLGHDAAPDGPVVHTYLIELNPLRQLDLVVMIDNSPSMAPKQQKLRDNFPKLIAALRNPVDRSLPDLRVAIIDSDLGTGGAYLSGSCGLRPSGGYGDAGRFQMIGASACGVTDSSALYLEYKDGQPLNFVGNIDTVFACLAGNLGTIGCGEEHQLQAFEFALIGEGIGNDRQQAMLRPTANLGLVFLSDEDDCSAASNDGMFGDSPALRRESASLRCVTRSGVCGKTNLTTSPPGYPTSAAFEAPLSTCRARTDACSSLLDGSKATDTSQPTTCSPLRSIKRVADEMKALKTKPQEQIFVVGIFGWPLDDADAARATFKIAPIPNPNTADTANPIVFDTWPICYDPSHPPAHPDATTGFDSDAAGWGATGGLRLSAFVDEFAGNGLKFSICQPDFSDSMRLIGGGMARKMQNLCVPAAFTEYTTCVANYLVPDAAGKDVLDGDVIPVCVDQANVYPCYSLVSDPTLCPGTDWMVQLDRGGASGEPIKPGTKIQFRCQ